MLLTVSVLNVIIASIIAIGLVEVVKNFLPDSLDSKIKTIIGIAIELAVAVVFVILLGGGVSIFAKIAVILATVSVSQLFYEVIIRLLNKLVDFLKSKANK